MSMDNAQFDAILRTYDRLQARERHAQARRFEEIYTKIPEYKALDESIPSISIAYAKRVIEGDFNAKSDMQKELSKITKQKESLLIGNGYPKDYLEMHYTCPSCKDTGYISGQKCSCLKNQLLSVLYAQSNLDTLLDTDNFDMLSEEYYKGEDLIQFRSVLKECHEFVDNFSTKKDNLFFYGNVGVGKSFLSCCIAKELLDKGYSVLYFSSSELFDILKENDFGKDSKENLYTSKEDIYNCDLVVIDDLGTELTNSYISTRLFSLINERILRNKSTIISTNLSLMELRDLYSDRIFSRICNQYKLCKLSGPDIRIYKKTASIRK